MVGRLTLLSTLLTLAAAGARPGQWKQLCDELVTRLDECSIALLRSAQRFLEFGDGHGAEIIQSSCVGCLAHLAVLCDLVGRLEPNSKPQMDTICYSSLERLGHLTEGMSFDGYTYTYFDLLLKVCMRVSGRGRADDDID